LTFSESATLKDKMKRVHFPLWLGLFYLSLCAQETEDKFARQREQMVKHQIAARGVTDERVLEVMRQVPRHRFVPPGRRAAAYADHPLPIGQGQTISQPYIVAYMTELLQTAPDQVVLEIGTGSGYQAAVLARLVKWVYTIEIIPELGNAAAERLRELGYTNVTVHIGDGYQGWPNPPAGGFDRIIVTAAPEEIPPKLVEQLKPGGRMVVPTGPQWWGQDLLVVEKRPDGTIKTTKTIPVRFVPMVKD
jgi:protein-L-isoaspartate(D-aspartate) O-methyltransferase